MSYRPLTKTWLTNNDNVMILQQRFKEHWHKMKFAAADEIVLLAVSGGSDSMAMADLFLKCGIKIAIAHCNFGLRGTESDLDERLVKDWCGDNNIVFHHVLFATKQKAEEWKKGTQETARILRYEWFEQIRSAHGYAAVATAHHANDNVETLLINLFKGTGISGMHGIRPRNGKVVRPLLFATKEEIAAYTGANDIIYREDASNASDDYLRNAVRHHVIPAIQQWFPDGVANANDSITRFAEAEQLYDKGIALEHKKLVERRGNDYYIPILKLRHRQPLTTICYELLSPFGFSAKQIPHALDLMTSESGRYMLSATHRIIRNRDFLVITTMPSETAGMIVIDAVPASIDAGKYRYTFAIQPKPPTLPTDKNTACLDAKAIEFPLVLRKCRTGDYFYPFGMKMKKKKVSRLLVDEKVGLHEKEDIRVLECGKRVAWVSGIRPDERFRVKESTEQILMVKRIAKEN